MWIRSLSLLYLLLPSHCLMEVRTFLKAKLDRSTLPVISTSVTSDSSTRLYLPRLNYTDGVLTFESLVTNDGTRTDSQISAAVDGVGALEMETFEIERDAKVLAEKISGFLSRNNGKEDSVRELKMLGDQLSAFTLRVKGLNPNITAAFSSTGKSSLEAGSDGPDDRVWGEGAINWDQNPSTPQPFNPSNPHTFSTNGKEPHIRIASRKDPRTGVRIFEGTASNSSDSSSSSLFSRIKARGCDVSGWNPSLSIFTIRADYFSAGINSDFKDLDRKYDCLALMIEANRVVSGGR